MVQGRECTQPHGSSHIAAIHTLSILTCLMLWYIADLVCSHYYYYYCYYIVIVILVLERMQNSLCVVHLYSEV